MFDPKGRAKWDAWSAKKGDNFDLNFVERYHCYKFTRNQLNGLSLPRYIVLTREITLAGTSQDEAKEQYVKLVDSIMA